MEELDCEVMVVGGGPVGLTLAGELGRRGTQVHLIEKRVDTVTQPKATLLGARSMEHFRAWGIDREIIDAGLPDDHPYYILFTTRLAEHELFRFRSPSWAECVRHAPEDVKRFPELQWSPYSKTQIGQQALEPVLRRYVEGLDSVTPLYGWEFLDFTDTGNGVESVIRDTRSGVERTITSRFLVACDGGSSRVRKALDVRLLGRGRMRGNVSFYFRSKDFTAVHGKGIANLYFTFAPGSFGVFTAIDARELWSYQHYFVDDEAIATNLDPQAILFDAVGTAFDFELLDINHWFHHQSVAECWRVGNVFLAGDAAHLFVPTGGVGMNTGIGDAVNLAWKLSTWLDGNAGEGLLASYEVERKPVAIRNSIVSANNSDKIDMVMQTVTERDADQEQAEYRRRRLSEDIAWLSKQFRSAGVHLGYRYESNVCISDGTNDVPDDPSIVIQNTRPGARFPHFWLDESTSTLDLLTIGFTLFISDADDASTAAPLLAEFVSRGQACELATLPVSLAHDVLGSRAVLVRPDGHVCWRGDLDRSDWATIVSAVLGS